MVKRSSYIIKEKILQTVRENPATYAALERKVNTGYRTIKDNCEELEQFDQVKIDFVKEHPANGRPSYLVSITERGLNTLKKKVERRSGKT